MHEGGDGRLHFGGTSRRVTMSLHATYVTYYIGVRVWAYEMNIRAA